MLWMIEKLEARIKELETYRYRDEQSLQSMRVKEDPYGEIGAYPDDAGEWTPIKVGDRWISRDTYRWLAADVAVPVAWQGRKIVLRCDFGKTGAGTNSGFESLLFLNGQPYQGVDSNHQEVFLPPTSAGEQLQLRFRLWSGLNGYDKPAPIVHELQLAVIGWLDEPCDDLYYSSQAVAQTIRVLGEHDPNRQNLLDALDRAWLQVDWSRPGSESFYDSVAQAATQLRRHLHQLQQEAGSPHATVTCVGHTHIDVAWLWRLAHTREKAARSFSTVLRLMEQYPEYLFLQTQPQLYAYMKKDYPQIYERIKERVADGRWEASGAMWLEADCNLPSGESLVRQIVYGKRFLREEFGVDCSYLWLPDVFGYSWALPQILQKSGIRVFMTTKISWNQYNRMPHDTFYWKGMDGSSVLTHFITTPDPGTSEGSFYYTYNGVITPETVQGIWSGYRDKSLNRNLLLAYGYGDGGGGVNREMLEMRRRLADMPGLPTVKMGRADDYFKELEQTIAQSDRYVHTWDGELYLELHRGTYTSQAFIKRSNRKMELLLRETEWLHTMLAVQRSDWSAYPVEALREAWTTVLRNQFHDIIPGSSIREVYDDARAEYAHAEQLIRSVHTSACAALTTERSVEERAVIEGEPRSYTVFQNSGWAREELVCVPEDTNGYWIDADGQHVTAQRTDDGWWIHTGVMPALGTKGVQFVPNAGLSIDATKTEQDAVFTWEDGCLNTPFYALYLNEQGQWTRLYDKQARREVLVPGTCGNVLQVFEDKPKGRHEAWDIDIFYTEKQRAITNLTELVLEECGPLRAVLRMRWTYGDSVLLQRLVVYAHSRRIDMQTEVDWQEPRQLLKAAFDVDVRAVEATYDVQFGNVKRPTHWNTSWDYARFETVGHQWADLSERGYGVSLINDCKYGYDIHDRTMRLSLIKAARVPDDKADIGMHTFTYALLPHQGDWFEGQTQQEAWSLNNPLTAVASHSLGAEQSLLKLMTDHVAIDAVKKAEDDESVIVRLHEFGGCTGVVRLTSDWEVETWTLCDLLEEAESDVQRCEGGCVELPIKPYEIVTLRLVFRSMQK